MKVIIHADDFGKDESTTRAIDEVMMSGLCDETSLMINMPYAEEAVALARAHGYVSKVGLHLNLTEGVPLTKRILHCKRICGQDGSFSKEFHMSNGGRFFFSYQECMAVKEEVEAQIKSFLTYGGLMMRIDSHHHVHTDWSVYRILMPLAVKYGFSSMRISADLHHVRIDKELYKRIFNRELRKHFGTTDHFDDANYASIANPEGIVEVMVHPIFSNGLILDTKKPYEESIKRFAR